MNRLSILAAVLAIAGCPAVAAQVQGKERAQDSADIQDCVKTKGPEKDKWESCIGLIAESCLADKRTRSTADQTACAVREQAVWDDILNETFRLLREKLDDKQKDKLRDMQRAWIASREKTCAFYQDYFQGTMATPMSAMCVNRETGRRALFLLGFLTDADSK